jgi:hypothetical protein
MRLQQKGLLRLEGWKYEGRPFVQADRGLGLIGELQGGAPECSTTTGPCTEMILATQGSQP